MDKPEAEAFNLTLALLTTAVRLNTGAVILSLVVADSRSLVRQVYPVVIQPSQLRELEIRLDGPIG